MRPAASAIPVLAVAALLGGHPAEAQAGLRPGAVVADGIPASLTGQPGDPVRGREIVVDRKRGLCLLCHAGPFPEQPFQGNLSPNLTGVGRRYGAAQLRLRIVDGSAINPDTIMPSYGKTGGLRRGGRAWEGRTILEPQEIEDVVAYLQTLRE